MRNSVTSVGLALTLLLIAQVPDLPAQRLSPRDSVSVSVDGKEISVAWGSPSIRGRQIFGGLVPWGEVWRTGANEATALRSEVDLVIGGAALPAGSYTLYTIPELAGWTLIINGETDQWGTQYDPALDVVRVPMRVETLDYPVEQFTILLACELAEPCVDLTDPDVRVARIMLSMEWEKTRALVAIEPAPTETAGEGAAED